MCNIILAQDRDGGDLGMLRQPAFQAVMGCVKRGTENQGRCSAGSSGVVRLGLCQGAFLERQFLVVMRSAFSLLGLVMGNQGVDRPTRPTGAPYDGEDLKHSRRVRSCARATVRRRPAPDPPWRRPFLPDRRASSPMSKYLLTTPIRAGTTVCEFSRRG